MYEQRSERATERQDIGRFMIKQKRIYHKFTPLERYIGLIEVYFLKFDN